MKSAIQPREDLVLDLVVQGQRHFRAVWPDLGELGQSHDVEVAAGRLKRELVWRIALYRQQNSARFEPKLAPETKVHRLGGSDSGLGHHDELAPIRLNTSQASFALVQRLIHMQSFL